jgi:hypothetical protein
VAALGREALVAMQAPEPRNGERRVLVCFDGDEVAEGRTDDLDLDRPQFTPLRHDAPLIDLLSEIRGLRHRGQISAVEYERRRSQVLNRI